MPGKTILLVDDSPSQISLMQEALAGRGYNLLTAGDGEEALRKATQQRPDLILLDILLPKRNGFQICRQVRSAPETRETKIILMSSKSQDTDRHWGLKQGANEYLTKPFSPEELAARVAK
ncbi:MAG: response regulator [Acidobacteria bacterium]|nr:response regulator [Acidobacteriota bacterium]